MTLRPTPLDKILLTVLAVATMGAAVTLATATRPAQPVAPVVGLVEPKPSPPPPVPIPTPPVDPAKAELKALFAELSASIDQALAIIDRRKAAATKPR